MIQKIISSIKENSTLKIENEVQRLDAISTIEDLLIQIDFTAETVPTNDTEKLQKLLTSLKGQNLNNKEIEIIKDIAHY
jgi:hypothetical protein